MVHNHKVAIYLSVVADRQLRVKMPISNVVWELVERVISASTYIHRPPSFVTKDWRFTDHPPAAQALTGAWIELMASPHDAVSIVAAMVEIALQHPTLSKNLPATSPLLHASRCPTTIVNTLALILTGLPTSFQSEFLTRIVDSFDWPELSSDHSFPSSLFETYSHGESLILFAQEFTRTLRI